MALRKIATISGPKATVIVYRDHEWNEYRARVQGKSSESDYHTDDKEDAIDTAYYLAGTVRPE